MSRSKKGHVIEYERGEDGALIAVGRRQKPVRKVTHRYSAHQVHSSWKKPPVQPPLTDEEREIADKRLFRDGVPDCWVTDSMRLDVLKHLKLR